MGENVEIQMTTDSPVELMISSSQNEKPVLITTAKAKNYTKSSGSTVISAHNQITVDFSTSVPSGYTFIGINYVIWENLSGTTGIVVAPSASPIAVLRNVSGTAVTVKNGVGGYTIRMSMLCMRSDTAIST